MVLPDLFRQQMQAALGQEWSAFEEALQQKPCTSVRVNDKIALPFTTPVPWCEGGYYLSQRPSFTLDPLLHAGAYYVQEASSMFLRQVVEQYLSPESLVLDLCAAPGGKSTLLSSFLGDKGLLVSNEVVRQRAFVLAENMQKWGNANSIVTFNQPAQIGEKCVGLFDCVLVDAPCSGEGMFRKEPEALAQWSEQNVSMCAARQKEIIRQIWPALRPNGLLIYSTCTYNTQENEDNVRWMCDTFGASVLPVSYDPAWGITETVGYHFYPHKTKGEGFYICALRKNDEIGRTVRLPRESKKGVGKADFQEPLQWLQEPEKWALRADERFCKVYAKKYAQVMDFIHSQLICISAGIGLAEVRGRYFVPQHSLALAKAMRQDAFCSVELSQEQALHYLRCEALNLEGQAVGILLVTYQHIPLGFVKNVGNHCNNLYPKEWRIRCSVDEERARK